MARTQTPRPVDVQFIDVSTGAGSLPALRRDLAAELALLMPATDGGGMEAALERVIQEVPAVLERRRLGRVRLVAHPLSPDALRSAAIA